MKGALRHLHGEPTIHDKVSGYYIAGEIGRTYEALAGMVPADQWTLVRGLSHAAFLALLMQLAQAVDLAKYRKHPRGPKKPSAPRMPASPTSRPPSSWGGRDDVAKRHGANPGLPPRSFLHLGGDCR